jgi:hypothetical protein
MMLSEVKTTSDFIFILQHTFIATIMLRMANSELSKALGLKETQLSDADKAEIEKHFNALKEVMTKLQLKELHFDCSRSGGKCSGHVAIAD